MLIRPTFVSNGPLERGAHNAYAMSSILIPTRFHFLFGYLRILCLKNVNLEYVCINGSMVR